MTHDRTDVDNTAGSTAGQPTYAAAPAVRTVRSTRFFGFSKEGINWGAVWGGLLTAIGLFILMSVLATAIGITATQETAVDAGDASRIGGVVSAVLALLAFFVGGYVAGNMSGGDGGAGALNGFLVWALALVLILILAAFGAGAAFGTLAQNFGPVAVDPGAVAEDAQSAAWIAFISLALAATAATLGGLMSAATDDHDHAVVS
ncbi:hypothetical protein BH20CHL8_BH20CHL8_08960 [soil metagenome]